MLEEQRGDQCSTASDLREWDSSEVGDVGEEVEDKDEAERDWRGPLEGLGSSSDLVEDVVRVVPTWKRDKIDPTGQPCITERREKLETQANSPAYEKTIRVSEVERAFPFEDDPANAFWKLAVGFGTRFTLPESTTSPVMETRTRRTVLMTARRLVRREDHLVEKRIRRQATV